jgi:hypothetical protein
MASEKSYLKALLFEYIPRRLKRSYRLTELKKLLMLGACIGAVGLGFVYGYVVERIVVRKIPLKSRVW